MSQERSNTSLVGASLFLALVAYAAGLVGMGLAQAYLIGKVQFRLVLILAEAALAVPALVVGVILAERIQELHRFRPLAPLAAVKTVVLGLALWALSLGVFEAQYVFVKPPLAYLEQFQGLVHNRTHGEELPLVSLIPEDWNRRLVLWLTETGKAGLFDSAGNPLPAVQKLLASGHAVVGADLLYQGEFLADGQPLSATRSVKNPREFLGYTTGYNHPLFAQRVHDVLSIIVAAKAHESMPESIDLVGLGSAALYAAAAAVQAGNAVRRLAVGTGGYRFATITEIRDPLLLPGAVRYGDVPGLLALRAPHPLWLHGEGNAGPRTVRAAYLAAGRLTPDRLTTSTAAADRAAIAAAEWLSQ